MSEQMTDNSYRMNSKLCRLVKAHSCIYKRSAPNYYTTKDNSYTDGAWAEISKEMNESVAACKKRWKNIRAAYARSVNIYKTTTGPNRHKRYYLYDELQFLTQHLSPGLLNQSILTPTELDRNDKESRPSLDQSDDRCTFEKTLDLNSSSPPPSVVQEPIQEEEYVLTSKGEPKPEPTPEPEPEYIELEPDCEEQPPQAKKYHCNISNEFQTVSVPQKRNSDPDFLASLLPELKTMNSRQKMIFKRKIFQALEEVFSDPKDFQQKHDPLVSAAPVTRGALARRFLGSKVFTNQGEKLPGESLQIGNFSIVQLAESHTEIKPEIEIEGVEDDN